MNITINKYSLVIRGNIHNPTVISETFFLKSGIVSDVEEIDRAKLIITPALCQVIFRNNIQFIVEPNTLNISGPDPKIAFEIGNKYCSNLGYIKSIAVGLNFEFEVENFDFENWFLPFNISDYKKCEVKAVDFTFSANSTTVANVTVIKKSISNALIRFNYHTDTKNTILSELNIDFVSSAEEFIKQSYDFINSILK